MSVDVSSAASGVEVVTELERLRALQPHWDSLWQRHGGGNPFLSFDWIWNWWTQFGCGRSPLRHMRLHIVAVWRGSSVCGIAPLRERIAGGPAHLRMVEFIQGTESYQDILADENRAWAVELVGKHLAATRRHWDLLELRNFPQHSTTPALISAAMQKQGLHTRTAVDSRCYYFPITQAFDSFIRTQTKPQRKLFRRKLRHIAEAGITVRIVEDPESIVMLLEGIAAVEKNKTRRRGQADLSDEKMCKFFEGAFISLASQGRLYVAAVENGNELIAYQAGLLAGSRLWAYCTAYNSEYARFSPGAMLMPAVVDWAFSRGLKEFDFLRGEFTYKLTWTKMFRVNRRVEAWSGSGRSRAKAFLYLDVRPKLYRTLSRLKIRPVPDWEI